MDLLILVGGEIKQQNMWIISVFQLGDILRQQTEGKEAQSNTEEEGVEEVKAITNMMFIKRAVKYYPWQEL